jgi:flagellar biosynthesis/type III secretory pathway protein FliH
MEPSQQPQQSTTRDDTEQTTQASEWPSSAGQEAQNKASGIAESVQSQANAATESIKQRARDVAEQQKRAGADQISGIAKAVEAAATDLQGAVPQAAEYIHDFASRLDSVASALREHSADEMLSKVNDFARKQPAVFFAGTVVTGFALSRFLKSSASRQG